jgi:hypothetical protein
VCLFVYSFQSLEALWRAELSHPKNGTTSWSSDGPEPLLRTLGDNSFCTPEEKKYNKKKNTTKKGIAYLSLDDCSMVE